MRFSRSATGFTPATASRSALSRVALVAALGLAGWAPSVWAAGQIDCKLKYNLSGWSVFYKTASGRGTVICSNGQSLNVKIRAKGGGLSFGKSTVRNGTGEFSGVHSINDVLGAYATAEAHAGAVKSGAAQAMTKGNVSLALAGKGEGWDIGVAFGKFVLSR